MDRMKEDNGSKGLNNRIKLNIREIGPLTRVLRL